MSRSNSGMLAEIRRCKKLPAPRPSSRTASFSVVMWISRREVSRCRARYSCDGRGTGYALRQRNAHVFKGIEEPVGLGDAGKRRNRAILKRLDGNRHRYLYICRRRTVRITKRWNRKFRQRSVRFLHDRRMGAFERFLGFSPAPVREKAFARDPFCGIDRDEIDIAEESAMLETIVENKEVPEVLRFCDQTCRITIRADDDGHAGGASSRSGKVRRRQSSQGTIGPVPGTDDDRAGTFAFVAARQNNWTETFSHESARQAE